jgi:EAL domain-containing protein (putative c-di-GMP-specific phosphodiesterase class I)
MRRYDFDELETNETVGLGSHVSGVHGAPTRPAPYVEELEGTDRLVGSIPRDQLSVEFQPIVNLVTGDTLAYEVFARCRSEGLIDPQELFARAMFEKCVGELGRTIREIATRNGTGSTLFLALHPAELKDRYLVRPDDPICFHDAPVFVQLSQASLSGLAAHTVQELSSRGEVGLVLDDLGAGPANLKQLVDLVPRAVKLDSELVAGIDRSQRKQAVVRALVSMCRELGASLIAKGLDCEAELQAAVDCGVEFGQGFVLGEPSERRTCSVWHARK